MRLDALWYGCLALACASIATPAQAATYKWVDENGKVQYGDRIPPQYQNKASEELNKRGIVTKKTAAALTPEQQKAKDDEAARLKIEKQKEDEQKRLDTALLSTFTSEKEIDLKRDRELQVIEAGKEPVRISLKSVSERIEELSKAPPPPKKGADPKAKPKPDPNAARNADELAKLQAEKQRMEQQLVEKDKDMAAIRVRYDEQKKRFAELKAKELAARK